MIYIVQHIKENLCDDPHILCYLCCVNTGGPSGASGVGGHQCSFKAACWGILRSVASYVECDYICLKKSGKKPYPRVLFWTPTVFPNLYLNSTLCTFILADLYDIL